MSQYKIIGKANAIQSPTPGYKIIGRANTEESEEQLPQIEEESTIAKLPRNIGIGLLNLGRDVLNTPYDVIKRAEELSTDFNQKINKDSLLPQELKGMMGTNKPSNFSEKVSHLPETDYAQMLGQKGQGTIFDKLIQGGVQYAPELLTGRALLKTGLKKFPLTQNMAGKPLREAERLVKKKEIPPIKDNEDLENTVLLARQYLDNSRETQRLLHEASEGKYEPLFSLQSQLGKEARSLKSSSNASDRRIYKEPQELKQDILNHMESHLRKHGENEVADLLRNGVKDYKTYIKMKEKIYPTLKKLGIPVGLASSLIYGKNKVGKLLGE